MTEAELTKRVCKMLSASGAEIFAASGGNSRQSGGWPDRYICHPLWQGWVEFKAEDGKLTTRQRLVIRRLNRCKPGCAVVGRFIEWRPSPQSSGTLTALQFEDCDGFNYGVLLPLDAEAFPQLFFGALLRIALRGGPGDAPPQFDY